MQMQLSNLPKITYVPLFTSKFETNAPTTTSINALDVFYESEYTEYTFAHALL